MGGGASGLSLVCHLADTGWRGRLTVVDDGALPLDHRAWAYWSSGDLLLDHAATSGVSRLRVHGPTIDRVLTFERHRYRVMDGSTLEEVARTAAGRDMDVSFVRGSVTGTRPTTQGAVVRVVGPHGDEDEGDGHGRTTSQEIRAR